MAISVWCRQLSSDMKSANTIFSSNMLILTYYKQCKSHFPQAPGQSFTTAVLLLSVPPRQNAVIPEKLSDLPETHLKALKVADNLVAFNDNTKCELVIVSQQGSI